MTDLLALPDLRPAGAPAPAPATPYLELDIDAAVARYHRLTRALPGTTLHYAVKANPEPVLLEALASAGCRFDVASPAEVVSTLHSGADADGLIYSHPVKRRDHVRFAAALGVDRFVVDSPAEVRKIAEAAPGAGVLCRLATSGAGSDWPLSRKFGCSAKEAVAVLRLAAHHGLRVDGVSFHVGSQQRDPRAWGRPVAAAAAVFRELRRGGLGPWLLDLGGGFPASLDAGCPPPEEYGAAIGHAVRLAFGDRRPRLIAEPGRGLVADAGTLVATVVGVVRRGGVRWVFLDAGVFSGLVETLGEAIRYPIETDLDGLGPTGPCVLAGPTCDSADVLYERSPVQLPLALAEGDRVRLCCTGAYVTTYSTVGFNGFDPLRTVVRADAAPSPVR